MNDLEFPSSWFQVGLGEILYGIQGGKSVKCDERPPVKSEKGLVKISAVTWGEFNENESKTLLDTNHLLPSQKIYQGDLLISRANTLELVGAVVRVRHITKDLYLSDKVLRIETREEFKPLIHYYLKSSAGRRQIESLATGNQLSMRNISQKAIGAIQFPLPSLAEQNAIAQKLDTLLAQVETTKARLDRIPDILKRFRQSVLTAAVSGKLTEDWRRGEGCFRRNKLSSICVSISDGDHQAPPKAESGVPFLVISNVNKGGIDLTGVSRWVPDDYYRSLKPIRKPEVNDILYTVTGSLGVPAIVETNVPFCFQRHIAIIKPDHKKVNFRFLALFLASLECFRHAEQVATGTAQKTVSLKSLRGFDVPLPPSEEQTQIVKQVETLFAHADVIEQQAQAAQTRVNSLTQSILAKAFRGELTAEWRAANPELISGENSSDALLAKIQAERDAAKPKKKARARQ